MALPILETWKAYFSDNHEGLGSSYERIILNDLLLKLMKRYQITSVLEAPIFGFTGITGINSIALAKRGCDVTLIDHDPERIVLINKVLDDLKNVTPAIVPQNEKNLDSCLRRNDAEIKPQVVSNYKALPFENNTFDMSWNFSALWFVEDLSVFLKELTRVTGKIILICVPNQFGLGYKWQKANTSIPHNITFNENNIDPAQIKTIMRNNYWKYIGEDFIDCPLWPDIGMSKEKFLGKYISSLLPSQKEMKPKQSISILDFYKDRDPSFPDRMRKFAFLENYAPTLFKKYWSHHKWLLFENPAL